MGRIIFNTTYHVHRSSVADWQAFMNQHFKTRIESSEQFSHYRICRILLNEACDEEAFAVQFVAESRAVVEDWLAHEGHLLKVYLQKTFGTDVLSFSTFMEEVE